MSAVSSTLIPSITRDEDDAKGLGQLVDRVLDDMLDFALGHGLFRIVWHYREGKLNDLGFQHARRQGAQIDARSLSAQSAQGLVHGNARQPGRKARVAAETAKIRKSPNVGFLDHILGLAIVAQNASGYPIKPAVVRCHDRTNGCFIACAGALDQFGIAVPGGDRSRWIGAAHGYSAVAAVR
jgi:hypothetical protein